MHIENMKLDFDNGLNHRAEDIFPNLSPCVVFILKWNQSHFKVIIKGQQISEHFFVHIFGETMTS